jgi:hypothetical protein
LPFQANIKINKHPKRRKLRRGWEAFFVVPWPLFLEPRPQMYYGDYRTSQVSRPLIGATGPVCRARYFFLAFFFGAFFLAAFFAME